MLMSSEKKKWGKMEDAKVVCTPPASRPSPKLQIVLVGGSSWAPFVRNFWPPRLCFECGKRGVCSAYPSNPRACSGGGLGPYASPLYPSTSAPRLCPVRPFQWAGLWATAWHLPTSLVIRVRHAGVVPRKKNLRG